MKNSKAALILSLILIIVLSFAAGGCSKKTNLDNFTNVNLYFANAEKNDLKAESRPIENISDKTKYVESVLTELLKGPSDSSLERIIPEKTRLIDAKAENSLVTVNLSKAYLSEDGTDNILARYSIANTLFEISGISEVKIFVDGVEIKNSLGEPIGTISKSNVVKNSEDLTQKSISVTLYFADDDANLVTERRSAPIIDNSVEKTIVTELLKGPENDKLNATIPQGTRLISVETKENVCFVNFSSEFVTKHSGGSTGEALTVYSIVNSLTELKNVDKVQFLVEGNKIDVYKHLEFNEPFERDDSMVK